MNCELKYETCDNHNVTTLLIGIIPVKACAKCKNIYFDKVKKRLRARDKKKVIEK